MVVCNRNLKNCHPKVHSKMRKETSSLCLFMILWNLIINAFHLPIVTQMRPWEYYGVNDKIQIDSRCNLCDFKADNDGTVPNSSERDAIVTISYRKLINLYPFVHSIRSTNCKARIFVFMDKIAALSQNISFFKRIEKCGVQFIITDDYKPEFLDDLYYYRYIIYHNFLFANRDKIDRVIACDMYDTIFQHDPFTEDFKSDRVYFCNEGYLIKDNDINLKTLELALDGMERVNETFSRKNINYYELIRNPIINGGTQAGGVEPFIQFSKHMTKIGNPFTLEAYGPEQAFLNYFLHTGEFNGLFKFEIVPPETSFISTIGVYILDDEMPPFGKVKLGDIKRGSKKPALIHQFDLSKELFNAVNTACPNVFNISDYSRDRSKL